MIFIDSQDNRYRMINRCINSYHMDESHMDVVANITLIVESEKGVITGQSSCITIVENDLFPVKILKPSITLLQCIK